MKAKRQQRALKYQYRLLWKYTGSKKVHELRADTTSTVLKMLRRVATKTPWLGVGRAALRKAWSRLCFRLNIPYDAIAGLSPREVIQRIQDTFPELEWVRVEFRQVGQWTEMIDPLNNLRTASSDKQDARTEQLFDDISQWSQAQLDDWRTHVTDEFLQTMRKTVLNNRENTAAPPRVGSASIQEP